MELHLNENRKKNSRFLAGLKNKRGKRHPMPDSFDRPSELIDIFRSQMQISEAMDSLIGQCLAALAAGRAREQIDVPQIILGFLNGMLKSDFPNEKSYILWKSRQADILEELLSSAEYVNDKKQSVDILIDRIRNPKDWDTRMSPSERFEVLSTISHFALTLSSMPPKYGILGESYYWSAGYQLNIRIYEKLLVGLFDILEDDHLIEEAGEILNLLKSSWSMLGITQKLHNVIHAWVLFQQKPSLLNEVMSMALMVGAYSFESCDKNKFTGFEALDSTRYRKVKDYVESSIEAVSKRVTDSIGHGHRIDKTHPLTVLASELKFISEKEMAVFYPILQQFCPEVGIVSALKLHKIYGERLGPFLNDVSCLSEGVREVLTAAVLLEDCLFELYSLGKRQSAHYSARTNEFEYYKVRIKDLMRSSLENSGT